MTKFETIGANYQYDSYSVYEANRNFKNSCRACCNRGIQLDCDRCAISVAHDLVLATFEELKGGKSLCLT